MNTTHTCSIIDNRCIQQIINYTICQHHLLIDPHNQLVFIEMHYDFQYQCVSSMNSIKDWQFDTDTVNTNCWPQSTNPLQTSSPRIAMILSTPVILTDRIQKFPDHKSKSKNKFHHRKCYWHACWQSCIGNQIMIKKNRSVTVRKECRTGCHIAIINICGQS